MKVAVDIIPYADDGRIVFVKRKFEPYKDCWALPGGFVEEDETIRDAGIRELKEETGIEADASDLEFICIADAVDRDPRQRVISASFYLDISSDEKLKAGSDAKEAKFCSPDDLGDKIAFDHIEILKAAMAMKLMQGGIML